MSQMETLLQSLNENLSAKGCEPVSLETLRGRDKYTDLSTLSWYVQALKVDLLEDFGNSADETLDAYFKCKSIKDVLQLIVCHAPKEHA